MSVLKCKMCGGNLQITTSEAIAECEFCGSKQTVPKATNDINVTELFNRANDLRLACEFDKAERVYEQIIEADTDEAEAYWGLILCKFGVEYVKDPKTQKRIPTCHRSSYDSIKLDINYQNALKYANVVQKPIYESEAQLVSEIQKGIVNLANSEDPYDVFICYKETDASGGRTPDSVLANDIYYQLKELGYKVFYAAITLEDKLGSAYEPYIFAALNSARVMLVIGTKPEYFNAVWVKNEWSRFLKLIKNDRKKTIIPCYRDMDAYNLPEEFAHLQALDMSKIGFINDIERACERLIGKKVEVPSASSNAYQGNDVPSGGNIKNLIGRMFSFLEEGDFESADSYSEKILDIDFTCGEAYLGKLMAEYNARTYSDFDNIKIDTGSRNFRAIMKYGDENLKRRANDLVERYTDGVYKKACRLLDSGKYEDAYRIFISLGSYIDAESKAEECKNKNAEKFKEHMYENALSEYNTALRLLESGKYSKDGEEKMQVACASFSALGDFNESKQYLAKTEEYLKEYEYLKAIYLYENKKYFNAKTIFEKHEGLKDAKKYIGLCEEGIAYEKKLAMYNQAVSLYNAGKLTEALVKFKAIVPFKEADEYIELINQNISDQEVNDLIDARNRIVDQIERKKKEIRRIHLEIDEENANNKKAEKLGKKAKKASIFSIIWFSFMVVFLFAFAPFSFFFLIFESIASTTVAKARQKSAFISFVLTFITVGIYGIVTAIINLKNNKTVSKTNVGANKLQAVNDEIAKLENALNEVDKKLDAKA